MPPCQRMIDKLLVKQETWNHNLNLFYQVADQDEDEDDDDATTYSMVGCCWMAQDRHQNVLKSATNGTPTDTLHIKYLQRVARRMLACMITSDFWPCAPSSFI